jgi:hypothetical protein
MGLWYFLINRQKQAPLITDHLIRIIDVEIKGPLFVNSICCQSLEQLLAPEYFRHTLPRLQ